MSLISEKQIKFIETLASERVNGKTYVETQVATYKGKTLETITSKAASDIIGVLLKEPKVAKMAAASGPKNFVKEIGMYTGSDGNLYKVQESKWNPGKFYAKRLVLHTNSEGVSYGKFEYDPSGMKKISPESKMALGEAVAYGQKFGVCCNCGATLTDPNSIAAGIGPICAGKF